MWIISWLAEELSASQEGFFYVPLIKWKEIVPVAHFWEDICSVACYEGFACDGTACCIVVKEKFFEIQLTRWACVRTFPLFVDINITDAHWPLFMQLWTDMMASMLFYWKCHSAVWIVRSWQCNSLELESSETSWGVMVVLNVLACWELRGIQQNFKEKKEINTKELCSWFQTFAVFWILYAYPEESIQQELRCLLVREL